MAWCTAWAGDACLFERQHHQRIAHVLQALDGPLLSGQGCLFGGGTAIALRHGEYRESVDMDFLVSYLPGYRALRQALTAAQSLAKIEAVGRSVANVVRADLRCVIRFGLWRRLKNLPDPWHPSFADECLQRSILR